MFLRDSYSNFPGHCALCTSAVVPVIDTSRDWETDGGIGSLYICSNCARNIAGLIGFIAPERLADLEDELERTCVRLDEQETENADLAAENETLRETVKLVTPSSTPKRGPGRPRKAE